MTWVVRRATAEDAPELGRINVAAWRTAYRGLVPDGVLDSMDVAAQVPRWQSWLDRPEPDAVWVAVDDAGALGAYCGVCAVREERDQRPGWPTGELLALYADPVHRGTGAGHAVHEAGVAHLVAAGFTHAVLWVFAANPDAQRFYRSHGWRHDPDAVVHWSVGSRELPEWRYSRSLEPPRSRRLSEFGST